MTEVSMDHLDGDHLNRDHLTRDHLTRDHVTVPPGALWAAAALILFTLAIAATARLTGRNHVVLAPTSVVASRDLVFADRRDGGIVITDAGTGRLVTVIAPATGGFLRGVMRGLVFEHRLGPGVPNSPFRLTRWADGRLSIEDPSDGERFELEAFGPTNEAAFAALLTDAETGDPRAAGDAATTRADAR